MLEQTQQDNIDKKKMEDSNFGNNPDNLSIDDDEKINGVVPITFGNYLDSLSREPFINNLKNEDLIFSVMIGSNYERLQKRTVLALKHSLELVQSVKRIQQVSKIPLLQIKQESNVGEKDIYSLAIDYIKCLSALSPEKPLCVAIRVLPKVYVFIDRYTEYSKDDDGKIHLVAPFLNGKQEMIISNNKITINHTNINIENGRVTERLNINLNKIEDKGRSYYEIEETENTLNNFSHKKYTVETESLEQQAVSVNKRQSYINNLKRTVKQEPLKTPLALFGIDQSSQKNISCLCGKGCCDLNDVDIEMEKSC